jgi:hypothetical protein
MIGLGKPPIIIRSNEEKNCIDFGTVCPPFENPHEIDAHQALPGKFMSW